ncbi:hypothetical protein [Paracoccus marinaquae]|uniref:Uncharacterized protein n=1 Tax=Paracoccus marinaquae TaxID=2841926 RepID=A0ABS6AG68_9RHOB|nr:hypothetical protein [Paracoccus marinaquae]MBU3029588.1 hypothetical protein [Paracoccus marinaquae]
MRHAERSPHPAPSCTARPTPRGTSALQRAADAGVATRRLNQLQSLADLRPQDLPGPSTMQGPPLQARILRDIPKGADGWSDRATLGAGIGTQVRGFIAGPVAGHPNRTVEAMAGHLDDQAFGNQAQEARVATIRTHFTQIFDDLPTHDWAWLTGQWSNLDYRIETLFSEVHGNKASIGGIEMRIGRGHGARIQEADRGEGGEGWRKRGAYGGLRSRMPRSEQHYVVGGGTEGKPGAERLYTSKARTEEGHGGLHAFYSPTHGDARAKGAQEYALVDNTNTIGGERIVAPWDPYLL